MIIRPRRVVRFSGTFSTGKIVSGETGCGTCGSRALTSSGSAGSVTTESFLFSGFGCGSRSKIGIFETVPTSELIDGKIFSSKVQLRETETCFVLALYTRYALELGEYPTKSSRTALGLSLFC